VGRIGDTLSGDMVHGAWRIIVRRRTPRGSQNKFHPNSAESPSWRRRPPPPRGLLSGRIMSKWLGLEKGNVSRPFLCRKEPASGFDVNAVTSGEIRSSVELRDGWSLSLRICELPWREECRGESPDEREMRRKAADRKPGVPVP